MTTARSRSTGCSSGMPRRPSTPKQTLRDEAGLSRRCQPDRTRHDPQPHLEQAVDHGHRDRLRRASRAASNTLDARGHRRDQRPRRAGPAGRTTPTPRSRRTCVRTRRSARELAFSDVDCGDGFLVDTSGWAVGDGAGRLRRGLRRRAGRHRRGRLDPVHRRSRARVPRRADPRHRRRGPALAGAQPQRVPAPRHVPPRGLVAEALLLEKLDARGD